MTIASHELALCIIHTGEGYRERCDAARTAARSPTLGSLRFGGIARDGARKYEKEFGTPGDTIFTAEDILAAAAELAEYYAQHVAETDAPPKIDLEYDGADNGNCRVYYKAAGRLYCWQMDDFQNKVFVLYSCSRDGEPSSPVRPECIGTTQQPKGEEAIERELREFLAARGKS